MTGGSLPAMTWHNIMDYAHQGIEIKQLPGIPVPQVRPEPAVAEFKAKIRRAAAAPDRAHQARRRHPRARRADDG